MWNWKKLNPKATESEKREFASYCGYDEANAYQQSISDEINDIIDVANNTPARSMRGLVSKARIADKTLRDGGVIHSVSDERVWSIIDDLLAMGAVQS